MTALDANNIIDYTYEDFVKGIDAMVYHINHYADWQPDYIVGIVRGGLVPAVYLSHKLKIPMVTVAWNTRDNTRFGNEHNCWIPEDINNGTKVLLVDDIVDGGDTIKELLEDWNSAIHDELKLDNLRIAAMYYNTQQPVKVDFYDRTIDRGDDARWVVFPWEA